MLEGGSRFVHADLSEIHGARRIAGMRIEAVAAARVAACEVDEMDGNVVFDGSADDSRMRGVIVFVRAENQNRFRQRFTAIQLIACNSSAARRVYGNFHQVNTGRYRAQRNRVEAHKRALGIFG